MQVMSTLSSLSAVVTGPSEVRRLLTSPACESRGYVVREGEAKARVRRCGVAAATHSAPRPRVWLA